MLAFIHIGKTGGWSIDSMLRSSFGPRHCKAIPLVDTSKQDPNTLDYVVPKYDPEDFRRVRRWCPPLLSIAGHPIALWSDLETVVPDVRYFAIMREPLARGASHYQYILAHDRPGMNWEDWLDWPVHHNHQTKMFSRKVDVNEAIQQIKQKEVFVGLLERFDESLVIFQKLYAPHLNIAYERSNTAQDNSLARRLLADPRAKEQMQQIYRADDELYQFVSRELYPAFRCEYGPTLEADVAEYRAHRRNALNRRNLLLSRAYERLVFWPLARAHRRRRSAS